MPTVETKVAEAERETAFVELYLGTGSYSYRDDGDARGDFERVLDSTQRGEITSVLVRPGVTE